MTTPPVPLTPVGWLLPNQIGGDWFSVTLKAPRLSIRRWCVFSVYTFWSLLFACEVESFATAVRPSIHPSIHPSKSLRRTLVWRLFTVACVACMCRLCLLTFVHFLRIQQGRVDNVTVDGWIQSSLDFCILSSVLMSLRLLWWQWFHQQLVGAGLTNHTSLKLTLLMVSLGIEYWYLADEP